jgi:hypothetical protein
MSHPDIADPVLRKVMANELLHFRMVFPVGQRDEYLDGVRFGIETILRRLCDEKYMQEVRRDQEPSAV